MNYTCNAFSLRQDPVRIWLYRGSISMASPQMCGPLICLKHTKLELFSTWKLMFPPCLFVWFDSLRPIYNLSVIKGRVFLGWTSTKQGLMCRAQRHIAVLPVRLEPIATIWSRVKHSSTDPQRFPLVSAIFNVLNNMWCMKNNDSSVIRLIEHLTWVLNRHVWLNLLNDLRKRDKMQGSQRV